MKHPFTFVKKVTSIKSFCDALGHTLTQERHLSLKNWWYCDFCNKKPLKVGHLYVKDTTASALPDAFWFIFCSKKCANCQILASSYNE